MRSESELMNYAEIFDFQQDSPFQIPDENILMPVDGNPMEEGQMVMDWDKLPVYPLPLTGDLWGTTASCIQTDGAGLGARLEICKKMADGDKSLKYIDLAGIIGDVKPMGVSCGFFKCKWVIESRGLIFLGEAV